MSTPVLPSDVVKVAPEYLEFSQDMEPGGGNEQMTNFIEIAKEFICEGKWGRPTKYVTAVSYLTAHIMKDGGIGVESNGSSSVSGPVTSERVGDLSRTYASNALTSGSQTDLMFSTTKYGRMYLALRKTLLVTPFVT